MARWNFFDLAYQLEGSRTDEVFGIFDPGNDRPACTTSNPDLYQAVVCNPHQRALQFVPIDHNLNIRRSNGDLESTCDGMMYDGNDYLAFIELKDKDQGWASEAEGQLRTTISLFKANHGDSRFRQRCTYAVNVRHPFFHPSFKQVMQQFKSQTGFILRFGRKIVVNY